MNKNDYVRFANYEEVSSKIGNLDKYSAQAINKATKEAKNRANAWVSSGVTSVFNIKKSRIKKDLSGKRNGNIQSVKGVKVKSSIVEYKGNLLSAYNFKMKPSKPRKKEYRVSIEVYKGKRVNLPQPTFLAAPDSKYLPFMRRGKKRMPIDVIKSISVEQMITNEQASKQIKENIDESLFKRIEHYQNQIVSREFR